eukprot:557935-Prymnesium_polylepis.1
MLTACRFAELAQCLPAALALDGAVVVTDVPGVSAARQAALGRLFSCAADHPERLEAAVMDDGTRRLSAGSRTLRGAADAFPECDGLADAADPLRAAVDLASQRVLRVLEPLVRARGEVLPASGGRWYASLSDVAHGGEQLEHFHAYLPATASTPSVVPAATPAAADGDSTDSARAIGVHTDGGLFIAMLPALYARRTAAGTFEPVPNPQPSTSGFLVERADGSVAGVPAAAEESSVVFALGE